nr:response regulator transcription factor [Treponema putidum]
MILTTFNDTEYIQKALQYGASGYLLKDSAPDVIYDGIKAAISGNIVINPEVAKTMLFESHEGSGERTPKPLPEIQDEYGLSQKEIEIIRLVAEGLSNKQIAYKQGLSEGTIKNSISVIFDKTFVADRTQLAAFAFKNGII